MNDIRSNLSTTATLGIEESGRYGEVRVSYDKFFFRKYNTFYCAKLLLTVSHNDNPIIYNIQRWNSKKKTWTTFWIKMLTWENEQGSQHSLQVRRQFMLTSAVKLEHNQNTIDCMAWLIINEPHGSNFYDHSWPFLQSLMKKLTVVERSLGSCGRT